MREKFEKMPAKGYVDLTKDEDPVELEEPRGDDLPEPPGDPDHFPPPARRVRQKTGWYHGARGNGS